MSTPFNNGFIDEKKVSSLWQSLVMNGQGFSVITGFQESSNDETDFLLLKNPTQKTLLRFKEFILTIGGLSSNTSTFRFYRNPTITSNGTALSINKILPSHSNTSGMEAYQNPTISNRGSLIQLFCIGFISHSRDQELSRFLIPGANLLVTTQGSVNNIDHNIQAIWAEQQQQD